MNRNLTVRKTLVQILHDQVNDAADVLLCQRTEHDDLIQPVQELRTEVLMQDRIHCVSAGFRDFNCFLLRAFPACCRSAGLQTCRSTFLGSAISALLLLLDIRKNLLRAQVGGQNDDGILEVYRSALRIRDPAVIQNLQQDVEHIGMCLFHLIKQNNRIRLSADSLGQLTALLVTDIAGCRADQTRNAVLLHVLGHIDPDHILLIVKQGSCKCLGKLCFADTGRSEEQE